MSGPFDPSVQQSLKRTGVVAVLVVEDAANAAPLARALLAGGVQAMELTLRTNAALDALRRIRVEVPDMLAGIGTILEPDQAQSAKAAGAAFGVAPGANRRVMQAAIDIGLPFAPGVATPSDIEAALEYGCRLVKFFPAETSGGMKHLKSMAAPYQHLGLEYMPLGGINAGNLADYLSSPLVAAVGGSWIATRELIDAGDWATIEGNSREAVEIAAKARG